MEDKFLRSIPEKVSTLNGVGPSAMKGYQDLGIVTKSDLLGLSPRTWENRSVIKPIDQCEDGDFANTRVKVIRHVYGLRFRQAVRKVYLASCINC